MDPKSELEKILGMVGHENTWRPVYDNDQKLIANGREDMRDGSPKDLSKVDFKGKSVLDLGCNFGFYSFLAKKYGAKKVIGIDKDHLAIKGSKILKEMHGFNEVDFFTRDINSLNFKKNFHICMLINFIGKNFFKMGCQFALDAVELYCMETMIISTRTYYDLSRHFSADIEHIKSIYPNGFINNNKFYLIDFIKNYFIDNWKMSIISPDYNDPSLRRTLLFTRKIPAV